MKEGWEYKKFEDALQKVKYTRKIQNSDYLPNGVVPVVSQEETFISGYWNNKDDAFKVDSPVVIFGDHSRVVKYVDFDFVLGADGVKILKPIDGLNARFFYHFLKWYDVPSLGYSRHYKLLKEIDVPFPPLTEQQQIVEELDLLGSIIEKKKAQLNELDNLAQSLFYEMFGDPITNEYNYQVFKLGDICSTITKGTTPTSAGFSFTDEGVNFIKVESFDRDESFNPQKVAHISKECNEALKRSILEENDILMCIAGATCGRLAIVPKEALPANTNQAFGIIRLKEKERELLSYVYSYLHSQYIKNLVNELMKGVAQPNLTLAHLRNFNIIMPPASLLKLFSSKIDSINHQKELIKQSIKEVETLFNSRMDYYFN